MLVAVFPNGRNTQLLWKCSCFTLHCSLSQNDENLPKFFLNCSYLELCQNLHKILMGKINGQMWFATFKCVKAIFGLNSTLILI